MRKGRGLFYRLAVIVLALWLAVPGYAIADTIDDVKSRQEELRRENEELEQKLSALKADEDQALEYQTALTNKITVVEQKVDAARESIRLMDEQILATEKKLEASRVEYQSTIDLFAQRITALYKSGSISTLEILLNSRSFSDFAMKTELMACVARHDQAMLDKIEEYLEKTKEDRESLQAMRAEETQIKKDLEDDQKELEALYAENRAVINRLEADKQKTNELLQANEEEDAELEEKLQDLIRKKTEEEQHRQQGGIPVTPSVPGMHDGFSPRWPVPGVGLGNITGHFGDIYDFDSGPHKGLDIGANYGTPIVAAQAGQVISAEFHYSWGNNVLIWHNGTFSTRYAHCSSLAVSVGDYVEQGDVIGYVGSTGFSMGNHLHFEVYYNGVRVDPDPYLGI